MCKWPSFRLQTSRLIIVVTLFLLLTLQNVDNKTKIASHARHGARQTRCALMGPM